jgi:hypothetical protein
VCDPTGASPFNGRGGCQPQISNAWFRRAVEPCPISAWVNGQDPDLTQMTDEDLCPPNQTRSARFAKCSFWKIGGWHTGTRYTRLSQNATTVRQIYHPRRKQWRCVALGRLLGTAPVQGFSPWYLRCMFFVRSQSTWLWFESRAVRTNIDGLAAGRDNETAPCM